MALAYRLVALGLIATGVIRLLDLFTADPSWKTLLYFTALSNVAATVWMLWLLLRTKGRMRWLDPLAWALFPLAYLAFAFIYGALGGEFEPGVNHPYPFMDVGALGVGGVALWILALVVVLEAFGFLLVAIDRGLGTLAAKRAQEVAPVRARV